MHRFYGNPDFRIAQKLEHIDKNRLQIWNQRQKSIKNHLKNLMQFNMKKNYSLYNQKQFSEITSGIFKTSWQ